MNKGQILRNIDSEQLKKDRTKFNIGDTVRVHTIVKEGDKERVQIFSGIVIARRGSLINESFTVRRISYGEGVERVFPVHSPRIAKIEVEQEGAPRRAKLSTLSRAPRPPRTPSPRPKPRRRRRPPRSNPFSAASIGDELQPRARERSPCSRLFAYSGNR